MMNLALMVRAMMGRRKMDLTIQAIPIRSRMGTILAPPNRMIPRLSVPGDH